LKTTPGRVAMAAIASARAKIPNPWVQMCLHPANRNIWCRTIPPRKISSFKPFNSASPRHASLRES
jgi:hypothetical protein